MNFFFYLSPIFRLLPSKTGTVKKIKTFKEKNYCVKFNNSWCNKFKFIQKSRKGEDFALCTACGSDFCAAH